MYLFQLPTPTPYTYVPTPYITALNPSDYSVWSYSDEAINVWHYHPALGPVIQTMVVFVLVIAFLMLLLRLLQTLQDADQ